MYSRNFDVNVGRLAYGSGSLLCRPQSFDTEADINSLCQVLHSDTLQVNVKIKLEYTNEISIV